MSSHRLLLSLSLVPLLVSQLGGCRQTTGASDRPGPLDAFRNEMLATSGMTEDDEALLPKAERCVTFDRRWKDAMEIDDPTPIIYEHLTAAVVCWRRALREPVSHPAVADWLNGWAGYVRAQKDWVWAQEAVEDGARFDACHRYQIAHESYTALTAQVRPLPERFTTEAARRLATGLLGVVEDDQIRLATDRQNQRCREDD